MSTASSRIQNYWQAHTDALRVGLWLPVFIGVGVAVYFGMPTVPSNPSIAVVLAGAALTLLAAWRAQSLRKPLLLLMALALGWLAAHTQTTWGGTPMLNRDIGVRDVSGIVADIEPHNGGVRILLDSVSIERMDSTETPRRVRFTYRLKDAPPQVGNTVTCAVMLKPVGGPVVPDGYNFRKHYYFERIGATGFAIKPCTVQPVAQETSFAISMAGARAVLRQNIQRVLQGDEAAITEALMTGVQQGISEPTMQAMRVSGLVHILSVSGLHIGLAAGIVFFAVRALLALFPFIALRFPIKKWAAVAALLSAIAYTLLVGAPIPAVRSCLMTAVMLVAVMLDRQAISLRVVALAATAVLLIWPASLGNPSFQMSFAAVAAIIALFESTERWRAEVLAQRPWYLRWLYALAGIAVASLVASVATLPFTYYHFQQMNLYGVLANMASEPLTAFWLMPMVVASFILVPFGAADLPLQWLGDGVWWLMQIASSVAALPGADWLVPAMPHIALVVIVVGGLWLLLWHTRARWWGLAAAMLGIVLTMVHPKPLALFDAEGRYAALRVDDARYIALTTGPGKAKDDNFTLSVWRRHLGIKEFIPADESPQCDRQGCVVKSAAGDIDVLKDPNAMAMLCGRSSQIVLLTAAATLNCPVLFDRRDLFRRGAHRIDIGGKISNTADFKGIWPWGY
jgi:competence protein ComEC